MNVLITGHSRGLGRALCDHYLGLGHAVFAISRGTLAGRPDALRQSSCDLGDLDRIRAVCDQLAPPATALDLVYLNAGVLGAIANLADTPLEAVKKVMDVNVWSNKVILDWLSQRDPPPVQVVAISSGAAISGNHGWGAYALSKAALNMLIRLYSHEFPHSHMIALAPGFVHTDMQNALKRVDAGAFPSVKRMHAAMDSKQMPSPETLAAEIADLAPRLFEHPTGSFVDLRKL
jgi:benzil reductase ((S)-benzoin forming)